VEYVDALGAETLLAAAGRGAGKRDAVLLVGHDGVDVDPECAPAELVDLAEKREHGISSAIVAGGRVCPGRMPGGIFSEQAHKSRRIAFQECVVAVSDQVGVAVVRFYVVALSGKRAETRFRGLRAERPKELPECRVGEHGVREWGALLDAEVATATFLPGVDQACSPKHADQAPDGPRRDHESIGQVSTGAIGMGSDVKEGSTMGAE
jgi:hypothetical protein